MKYMRIITVVFFLALSSFLNYVGAQTMSTYAGDTTSGYSGDGGLAIHALLRKPVSVATDIVGNLYIADQLSNCVRKVDTNGIISTFAGTGTAGYNGDSILATNAQLNGPVCVATDKLGNVYISDANNNRIRKVNASGVITTEYYEAYFFDPAELAINSKGEIFGSWYKIQSGIFTPLPITSLVPAMGTSALFFDSLDNLYIGNTVGAAGKILVTDTSYIFSVLAGNGSCGSGTCDTNFFEAMLTGLHPISGIAKDDSGDIYFAESVENVIFKLNSSGMLLRYAGSCAPWGHIGGSIASSAAFDMSDYTLYNGMAMDKKGNVYIAEPNFHDVRKITKANTPVTTFVSDKSAEDLHLNINPNPCNGVARIYLSVPLNEIASISVTNVTGEHIMESTFNANTEYKTNLNLPAGVYFVSVLTSKGKINSKLIVN
jgi:hypothetical protein